MDKKFCDLCGKKMNYHPENFCCKKIEEINTPPKVRGKGCCAHVVRSGEKVNRYIYLYATAERTDEYGGDSRPIDVCKKCILGLINSTKKGGNSEILR